MQGAGSAGRQRIGAVLAALAAGCAADSALDVVPRNGPLPIEVTGRNFAWSVRYPGRDGLLHTPDDVLSARDVHVPVDTETVITLKSDDFIYVLALPDLALSQIAVPQLEFQVNVRVAKTGSFRFRGDPLCGSAHEGLSGRLVVHSHRAFGRFMAERSPA